MINIFEVVHNVEFEAECLICKGELEVDVFDERQHYPKLNRKIQVTPCENCTIKKDDLL